LIVRVGETIMTEAGTAKEATTTRAEKGLSATRLAVIVIPVTDVDRAKNVTAAAPRSAQGMNVEPNQVVS
jgi:hypothetical protein